MASFVLYARQPLYARRPRGGAIIRMLFGTSCALFTGGAVIGAIRGAWDAVIVLVAIALGCLTCAAATKGDGDGE